MGLEGSRYTEKWAVPFFAGKIPSLVLCRSLLPHSFSHNLFANQTQNASEIQVGPFSCPAYAVVTLHIKQIYHIRYITNLIETEDLKGL